MMVSPACFQAAAAPRGLRPLPPRGASCRSAAEGRGRTIAMASTRRSRADAEVPGASDGSASAAKGGKTIAAKAPLFASVQAAAITHASSAWAFGEQYIYTTKDLAVDLVLPLVAYKIASSLFQQKLNVFLDGAIAAAVAAAVYVCVADVDTFDRFLH